MPEADAGTGATGGSETGRASVYDWWSRHPRAMDLLYAFAFMGRESTIRERSVAALDPAPGERVLEVGCGAGRGFGPLREGLGPEGELVGLDASAGMVRAARERAREAGWGNVSVVRGDARRPPLAAGSFDAVYAAMSVSAVPEPTAAIEAIRGRLRPGGRLVLLDARPFRGPLEPLNAVVVPVSRALTDWVPEVDLVGSLRATFEDVSVTDYNGGTVFVAVARVGDGDAPTAGV
jgi:demethylmenaquinone methyltransferase/2-methoxy-6-polyprenyl-1,4-benzoquinol methylase